ncbi:MAG: spiro-SPASM protein [Treponema sp.]|jgi:spiro-SPASM protein|nr:spiro-SPASM protein [Treponema sp.]
MKAFAFLYGADLRSQAFQKVFPGGKSAFDLALERVRLFPHWHKTVLLGREGDFPGPQAVLPAELVLKPRWTRRDLLAAVSRFSQGCDLSYFAWADCPFLDPELSAALAARHVQYAAEYSYADGWPYGFAPELLAPGVAGILAKIEGDEDNPVERDSIFAVVQKDINSFDIETEISPVDLRSHRLHLAADSKRNLLLLSRFSAAAAGIAATDGIPRAAGAAEIIETKPEILRTLPVFYPVQAARPCPQSCALCPYPAFSGLRTDGSPEGDGTGEDFLDPRSFEEILDRILAFSGDGIIDLSLWGELALHPRRMEFIRLVLERPQLALVIETSGIGWSGQDLEQAAALVPAPGPRPQGLSPLSWIVSLDTADPLRYRELRGPGFTEAVECAKKLLSLFPGDSYVQALRTEGAEDDIEKFYRGWKELAPRGNSNIIIQKYDDFCGCLQKKQASDISPVERQSCWHIMRDLPVLLDGTVPLCREELSALKRGGRMLGNIYRDSLETIWSRGEGYYAEHCQAARQDMGSGTKKAVYPGPCAECDEYYTYNF